MSGIVKAIQEAFTVPTDRFGEDLLAKLDENERAAEGVRDMTAYLDKALCLKCGPHREKLKRRKALTT